MDPNKVSKFLVKAKINTYASSGEGGEKILPDGGKEFEFKDREFKYRDRYLGFDPFIGEEIVWQNEKIIWGMNYYGRIISETVSAKQIYQFLQEALKKVTEDKPFRGPDNFRQGDFEYFNKTEGTVENFNGDEKIFYRKQLVYQLNYNGGLVTEK